MNDLINICNGIFYDEVEKIFVMEFFNRHINKKDYLHYCTLDYLKTYKREKSFSNYSRYKEKDVEIFKAVLEKHPEILI